MEKMDVIDVGISCPSYKPYLCADGSCQDKSFFCKSYAACIDDKPFLCKDRTCSIYKFTIIFE